MISGKDKGRLLIIREMLDEARAIVDGNPVDYSLMKAVWLADLAVELNLAAIASDLGLDVKRNPYFGDYLEAVCNDNKDEKLVDLKLHKASLYKLHNARNRVHDGLAFTHDNSKRLVQAAEAFIQTAFKNVYELDIDALSLVSFLNDGKARDCLVGAEDEIARRNYSEAVFKISIALEIGRRQLRKKLKEKQNSNLFSETLFPTTAQSPRKVSLEEKGVKKVAYFFELSRYGIDVDKAIKYEERVPKAHSFNDEGPWISESGIQRTYSESEVTEYLNFVADALYRFQSYAEKL